MLEYASEVFDGCSASDVETLDKIQREAARIIAGLPLFVSRCALFPETGLATLVERRMKLCTMNGEAPEFLVHYIPPSVEERVRYRLWTKNNISIPFTRTTLFKMIFLYSVTYLVIRN